MQQGAPGEFSHTAHGRMGQYTKQYVEETTGCCCGIRMQQTVTTRRRRMTDAGEVTVWDGYCTGTASERVRRAPGCSPASARVPTSISGMDASVHIQPIFGTSSGSCTQRPLALPRAYAPTPHSEDVGRCHPLSSIYVSTTCPRRRCTRRACHGETGAACCHAIGGDQSQARPSLAKTIGPSINQARYVDPSDPHYHDIACAILLFYEHGESNLWRLALRWAAAVPPTRFGKAK